MLWSMGTSRRLPSNKKTEQIYTSCCTYFESRYTCKVLSRLTDRKPDTNRTVSVIFKICARRRRLRSSMPVVCPIERSTAYVNWHSVCIWMIFMYISIRLEHLHFGCGSTKRKSMRALIRIKACRPVLTNGCVEENDHLWHRIYLFSAYLI